MKTKMLSIFAFTVVLFMSSCGEGTSVVESGTYEGIVHEVEPEETEIYVKTADEKILELYFTDETTLTRAGKPVEFSVLEKGQKVKVTVEKVGKRLDPISVVVLE